MRNRLTRIGALLRIELGISYRFPIVEGLVAFMFFSSLWNMMTIWHRSYFHIDDFHVITDAVIGFPKLQFYSGVIFYAGWLAILIPVLASFAIAKSFEEGFIQTLVTYPVGRTELMLVKTALIIVIPACTSVFSFFFAFLVAFSQPPLLSDIAVVLSGLCLSVFFFASLSLLIAVASRRVSTTAVFGIAYGFATSALQNVSVIPNIFRVVLNPLNAAGRLLVDSAATIANEGGMTIVDLQYGFGFSLVISAALLAVSLWVFRHSEV